MVEEFEGISFDDLESLYDEAQSLLEEATSYAQIGKFHSSTTCHIYKDGQIQEVGPAEWRAFSDFKFLNLNVEVDVKEFSPDGYDYTRRIQVKRSPWNRKLEDGTYEKVESNWFAIWEPSVKNVVPNYKSMAQALRWLEGKYVKVLDVLQQPTKRQPEPQYNTAKLVEVYDSREEAYAAHQSLRGSSNSATSDESGSEVNYEQDVIDGVETLNRLGKTVEEIAGNLGLTVEDVQNILG